MSENKKLEFETRGKILSSSLLIEELLNKIIYNYFILKSIDKITRSKFLDLFIFSKTFGRKKLIYIEILKMDRYKQKVEKSLISAPIELQTQTITNYISFKKAINDNLNELIETRNNIAHGFDLSKAFIALEENEVVFANKSRLTKINNKDVDNFIKITDETIKLLEITKGKIQD